MPPSDSSLTEPRTPRSGPIRVLIADDSATARALLVHLFNNTEGFTVIGEARTGAEAVELTVELSPDLVTMDIQMPVLDGLDATKEIMREAPTPILVVTSSVSAQDVEHSLSAVQAGALMVLEKPVNPNHADFEQQCEQLVQMARAMADVKVVRRWSADTPTRISVRKSRASAPAHWTIAIAASTGGPAALRRILLELSPGFPAPVFIVQHIARGFVSGLVSWLGTNCRLRVIVARHGETPAPGTVYVAPDDRHLGMAADGTIALSDASPIGGFRPSADYLFDSIGRVAGARLVSVILTGMGRDGVEGLRTVRRCGGKVLAQNEESSVVYGMAREAVEAGVVHEVLPIESIAARITTLVKAAS